MLKYKYKVIKTNTMSLLKYVEFQPIDHLSDPIPEEHTSADDFSLDDQIDEESLEKFWDQVVKDIHQDPEWFKFSDK